MDKLNSAGLYSSFVRCDDSASDVIKSQNKLLGILGAARLISLAILTAAAFIADAITSLTEK